MESSINRLLAFCSGRRWLLVGVALTALLVPLGAVFGQEDYRISIDQVIVAEDGERLTTLVSVLDPAGQPLLGLIGFEAAIDGDAVPVESAESVVDEEAGMAALLLIDVSRSMEGAPLAQARQAAGAFVRELRQQDVAAVAAFAETAPSDVSFTADRSVLAAAIDELRRSDRGGTALYDALVEGLSFADRPPAEGRAVVLVTDGQDSGDLSDRTREDALSAAASAGFPVFAIGLGASADNAFLRELADTSGGRFYEAPTEARVPAIFAAIGATLGGRYALTLSLPKGERAERNLLVAVDVEGAPLTARASFQAPYFAGEPGGAGGGLSLAWLAAAAGVVVVIAMGVVALVRRRRRRAPALTGGPGRVLLPARVQSSREEAAPSPGRLTVVEGPNAGVSVPVTTSPVEIGSDPACGLHLSSEAEAVAGIHARGWLQGGRLMLHHLARGRQTFVRDEPIEWATLEPDEALQIGPWVIAFTITD